MRMTLGYFLRKYSKIFSCLQLSTIKHLPSKLKCQCQNLINCLLCSFQKLKPIFVSDKAPLEVACKCIDKPCISHCISTFQIGRFKRKKQKLTSAFVGSCETTVENLVSVFLSFLKKMFRAFFLFDLVGVVFIQGEDLAKGVNTYPSVDTITGRPMFHQSYFAQ